MGASDPSVTAAASGSSPALSFGRALTGPVERRRRGAWADGRGPPAPAWWPPHHVIRCPRARLLAGMPGPGRPAPASALRHARRRALRHARRARWRRPSKRAAGQCGPTGAQLEPMGRLCLVTDRRNSKLELHSSFIVRSSPVRCRSGGKLVIRVSGDLQSLCAVLVRSSPDSRAARGGTKSPRQQAREGGFMKISCRRQPLRTESYTQRRNFGSWRPPRESEQRSGGQPGFVSVSRGALQ